MQPFKINPSLAPPKSLADQIYDTLKSSIINGEIAQGHRLFETELAQSFHASRTPVREAFRRLEHDQLVERVAQGGVQVTQFDRQTIKDLFSTRRVLEAHAISLACDRITDEQIAALKQIRAQALELLKSKTFNHDFIQKRFFELNSLFHETIYESTGSKFLIKLVNQLRGVVLGLRTVSIQADPACQQAWEDHTRLIEYLETGNKKAAVALIKKHVANAAAQFFYVIDRKLNSKEKP